MAPKHSFRFTAGLHRACVTPPAGGPSPNHPLRLTSRLHLAILALVAAGMATAGSGAHAQASEVGLITARESGGFWATFAHPVAQGSIARVRAFREGVDVAQAKVQWASAYPPYDAFITDVNPPRTKPAANAQTPYAVSFHERGLPGHIDRGEAITTGFFVAANPGAPGRAKDVLRGLLDQIETRPDFREYLRAAGRERADWADVGRLMGDTQRIWLDPVTARLAESVRALLRARGNVQGRALPGWFPAELAQQKSSPSSGR